LNQEEKKVLLQIARKSIEEHLKKAGFSKIITTTIINKYPLTYWTKLLPINKEIKLKIIERLKKSKIQLPLPVGNFATFAIRED